MFLKGFFLVNSPAMGIYYTLSEKQYKFPRYNMKCTVMENMTLHELFREVSRFSHYISCYIAENRLSLGQCNRGSATPLRYISRCIILIAFYKANARSRRP